MSITTETKLNKPADNDYPVLEVIRKRWSTRAYDKDRPVEVEKLRSILEAARWAASSFNTQPWRFIVATREDQADFAKLLSILNEGNQSWAQDAPVLMLAVAKNEHEGGYPNRHAQHDVGAAIAHIALQATALGLHMRPMGGFDVDKSREVYAIPDDYTPMTALALGYQGILEHLDDKTQQKEKSLRTRKPLSEWVFADTWGQVAPLVE